MNVAGGPPRIPQSDRDRIADLHAQGYGRNEIARQVGRSLGTVTKVCQELGLSFDRAQMPGVAAGNVARQEDLKARRLALQSRLLARAEHIFTRLEAPKFTTLTKAEYGVEVESTLGFVPARDEKDLVWAIGSCLANEERLERINGDGGDGAARSMLTDLFGQVQAAWDHARQERAGADMDEPTTP